MTPPHSLAAALRDRYVIEHELGAGGMATVYLAHDVRHDRKVALKVLRPELAAILGAERFLAEIKTTANLQHPHILSLFDSGEADGLVFYVMPYVEGESLRDRLVREHQLPVEDAVRIAGEVADALEYAHEHGIVHRDIKPENILLHGGHALVADFGIALAAVRSEGGTRMTETGMSLGTPQYMSPEQAMGEREISPRSDVYALGCVLYEMLAGEPPFTGPTPQAIVARVMTEAPRSLTLQRHTIPVHLDEAIRVALEKLPADRFTSAAQFRAALTDASALPRTGARAAAALPVEARRRRRTAAAVGTLSLAALVTLGFLAGRRTAPGDARVLAFQLTPGPDHRLGAPYGSNLAVSPDGRTIAYIGQGPRGRTVYVRPLDSFDATPVAGSEGTVYSDPTFTADGQAILWGDVSGRIYRAALAGGATTQLAPTTLCCTIFAGPDDGVYLTTGGGLELVPGDNGPGRVLGTLPVGASAVPLPGFKAFVVASPEGQRRVQVLDAGTGRLTPVDGIPDGVDDVAYADGYLFYQTGTTLSAVPFDAGSRRIRGRPVPLLQNVRIGASGGFRTSQSAVGSGILIFVPSAGNNRIALVDRAGREQLLPDTTGVFHRPRFAPGGRRLSVDITRPASRDVWVYDFDQRTLTRVTFEPNGHDAIWAPDGAHLLYAAAVQDSMIGILSRRTDGSSEADTIASSVDLNAAEAVLPDRNTLLVYSIAGSLANEDVWLLDRTTGTHRVLLGGSYNEGGLSLSHDGRWLAYVSDESGRNEVYVRALEGGPRVQVSTAGGREPVWNPRGGELFYREQTTSGARLMAARVSTAPLRVLARDTLFDVTDYEEADPHANYDVSPDGTRFVFIRQEMPNEIRVIRNWKALLAGR